MTTALGAALGAMVSISSVGAGAIGVTALLMIYPKMTTVRPSARTLLTPCR